MEQEMALATIERPMEALSLNRQPEVVLEEARKAATALKQVIDGKKKKITFNGETYLENEDWLTVARFYGVTSRIRSAKYIEFGEGEEKVVGFEATAEAFLVGSETIISTAESMCLNDEPNWSRKPLFQLKSMAQTRASSRVLRQVFGWVVVLAGYKATPAEEMAEVGNGNYGVQSPRRKSQPIEVQAPQPEELNGIFEEPAAPEPEQPKRLITEKQQKRLFAISKAKGWTTDEVRNLLAKHGYEHSTEIPSGNVYNEICAELELRA